MSQCQKSSSTHDQVLPTVTPASTAHSRLQLRYILVSYLPSPRKLPKWQIHAWSPLKSPWGLPKPHRSASHRLASWPPSLPHAHQPCFPPVKLPG